MPPANLLLVAPQFGGPQKQVFFSLLALWAVLDQVKKRSEVRGFLKIGLRSVTKISAAGSQVNINTRCLRAPSHLTLAGARGCRVFLLADLIVKKIVLGAQKVCLILGCFFLTRGDFLKQKLYQKKKGWLYTGALYRVLCIPAWGVSVFCAGKGSRLFTFPLRVDLFFSTAARVWSTRRCQVK